MVAAHDGKGVMGIAPMASVVAYNPFDASRHRRLGRHQKRRDDARARTAPASSTCRWACRAGRCIRAGTRYFRTRRSQQLPRSTVFVVAAGNDGSTQTKNVTWNFATESKYHHRRLGRSDEHDFELLQPPRHRLSGRRATSAALRSWQSIDGPLYRRARARLILVSDGKGGATRMSGTSFAAPLVSGTIALLHDRWPWLSQYPKESVDIILMSAKDLGASGTDAVYGRGQLDVTAALSPLSFNGLRWYTYDSHGGLDATQVNKIRRPSEVAKWEAEGMTFFAYEDIGGTFRDFAIPASSKLADQSAMSAGGTMERLQAYIYERFLAWVNGGGVGQRAARASPTSRHLPRRSRMPTASTSRCRPPRANARSASSKATCRSRARFGSQRPKAASR